MPKPSQGRARIFEAEAMRGRDPTLDPGLISGLGESRWRCPTSNGRPLLRGENEAARGRRKKFRRITVARGLRDVVVEHLGEEEVLPSFLKRRISNDSRITGTPPRRLAWMCPIMCEITAASPRPADGRRAQLDDAARTAGTMVRHRRAEVAENIERDQTASDRGRIAATSDVSHGHEDPCHR